jgi:polyhydroxyalkanoate synthesis repressor PhaR
MRIIKKYPNRRLYDTERSAYITLNEVHQIVRSGEEFKVVDANSGEDITRAVLVQIITEQEGGEKPIFSTEMLTKFIRFYDDAAQTMFGDFLEKNMQSFVEQQKRFMDANPLPKMMADMAEHNMAIWQDMQKSFFDIATGALRPSEGGREKPEAAAKKAKE